MGEGSTFSLTFPADEIDLPLDGDGKMPVVIVESDEKIRMWQKMMVDLTTDDHEQSLLPLTVLNRRRRLQKNITWAKIVLCALEERLTKKKKQAHKNGVQMCTQIAMEINRHIKTGCNCTHKLE